MNNTDSTWATLGDFLNNAATGAGSILNALKPADNTAAKAAAANAQGQAQTWKTILPWAAGGVVLLVLAVVLSRK